MQYTIASGAGFAACRTELYNIQCKSLSGLPMGLPLKPNFACDFRVYVLMRRSCAEDNYYGAYMYLFSFKLQSCSVQSSFSFLDMMQVSFIIDKLNVPQSLTYDYRELTHRAGDTRSWRTVLSLTRPRIMSAHS